MEKQNNKNRKNIKNKYKIKYINIKIGNYILKIELKIILKK